MHKKSQNQNYTEYYQGETPRYSPGGSVDFSQLSSVFSRTPETMEMVYQYAPQISQDVSYIFDFSNQGAYGVYIPALVEEIKTKELKSQLEQKGYTIGDENGMMVAYPDDKSKDNTAVKEEIRRIWDQINAGKSEVLGINMNKVRSSTEENMRQIVADAEASGMTISNPNLLWDVLTMLELGSTIVHEWEHSLGGDESSAQGRESDFVNKMIDTIKQKYQAEAGEEMPIAAKNANWYRFSKFNVNIDEILKKHILSKTCITTIPKSSYETNNNWYRFAQYTNYTPETIVGKPTGSDLDGRMGKAPTPHSSLSDWSMMAQQDQSVPMENRLGRGFMWPLAPGLDQNHDSIEKQLRKQFANDHVPNTRLVYEELLSIDRDDSAGYKLLENLMEERRPQPLMVPLEKNATRLKKEATLFGWYNNLEISDGSTIPGLGDRVMAWDDRDESFSEEESWIKEQPRYNPTYDLKGFYFRWIEPHFKPRLWTDVAQDYTNTHPAKRFAQAGMEAEPDLSEILNILETIKARILEGRMKATRLMITSDIYNFIKAIVDVEGILIKTFRFGKTEDEEAIYAVWVCDSSISTDVLRKAESKFQNKKTSDDIEDLIEDLMGFSYYRSLAVEEIINTVRSIANKIGLKDIYVVGMYAREKAMGNNQPDVEQIDISTPSIRMNGKIGQLLADTLGVSFDVGDDLTFAYKNIKVEFSLKPSQNGIEQISVSNIGDSSQMIVDLLRRDFTINMFAYDLVSQKVIDPLTVAQTALYNSVVKTYHDPYEIIKNNPIVILRALKLHLQYDMEIDDDLKQAMVVHADCLFKGKCSKFELLFARESIQAENEDKANKLFDKFGLWKLKKIKGD